MYSCFVSEVVSRELLLGFLGGEGCASTAVFFNRNHVAIIPGVDKENCRKPYQTWPIQEITPISPESW